MKSLLIFSLVALAQIFSLSTALAGEGHDAGRDWAEDNGITDPDDCGGNSSSFIEGCEEYAEEQQEENEEEEEE